MPQRMTLGGREQKRIRLRAHVFSEVGLEDSDQFGWHGDDSPAIGRFR